MVLKVGDFRVGKVVGAGSFGEVRDGMCIGKSKQKVALKFIKYQKT